MPLLKKFKKLNRETVRLKVRNDFWLPRTCKARARGLEVDGFTIISNNCWGGTIYESYGMRKDTPTVGMFIMPSDFVRFAPILTATSLNRWSSSRPMSLSGRTCWARRTTGEPTLSASSAT